MCSVSKAQISLNFRSLDASPTDDSAAPMPAGVDLIPVRGFRLAPLTNAGGAVTVDGESVECNCIQESAADRWRTGPARPGGKPRPFAPTILPFFLPSLQLLKVVAAAAICQCNTLTGVHHARRGQDNGQIEASAATTPAASWPAAKKKKKQKIKKDSAEAPSHGRKTNSPAFSFTVLRQKHKWQ